MTYVGRDNPQPDWDAAAVVHRNHAPLGGEPSRQAVEGAGVPGQSAEAQDGWTEARRIAVVAVIEPQAVLSAQIVLAISQEPPRRSREAKEAGPRIKRFDDRRRPRGKALWLKGSGNNKVRA